MSIFWNRSHRKSRIKKRRKLYNLHCSYCGHRLDEPQMTLDHAMPKSIGGGNTVFNLIPCCPTCNKIKSNMTPIEFKQFLLDIKYVGQVLGSNGLSQRAKFFKLFFGLSSKQSKNISVRYDIQNWDGKFYFEKNRTRCGKSIKIKTIYKNYYRMAD